MPFHGLEGSLRRTESPEKQAHPTPIYTLCFVRTSFPVAGHLSLAPHLVWVGAEFVLVRGEALLWDLVGSGPATWLTSTCHKDINANE